MMLIFRSFQDTALDSVRYTNQLSMTPVWTVQSLIPPARLGFSLMNPSDVRSNLRK